MMMGDAAARLPRRKFSALDPAEITNKIAKYTGAQFDSFTIAPAKRKSGNIAVMTVGAADPPIIFERPGAYEIDGGNKQQQKTAFGTGTLYVRHGAKSEPARYVDVVKLVDRSVQQARREWLSATRKIAMAPKGSIVSILPPKVVQSSDPNATPIRITDDSNAPAYHLIEPDKTFPWRQKELLERLDKLLPVHISSYDLLALRRFYGVDSDPKFVLQAPLRFAAIFAGLRDVDRRAIYARPASV